MFITYNTIFNAFNRIVY